MQIIIIGSSGAMGKILIDEIEQTEDLSVYAGYQLSEEKDELFPVFNRFDELSDYVSQQTAKPDIMIDFSTPKLTEDLLVFAVKHQLPLLLATTGQNEQQLALIEKASKEIPIFNTNNTSIGVAVMLQSIFLLTKTLYPLGYDIEIIEKHHRYKKDSPSGTAITLKNTIQSAIDEQLVILNGRSGLSTGRQHREIAIHSIRGGDIVGEHTVIFANNQETIEITHQANNKLLFVQGAIECARFLISKDLGLFEMNDLMLSDNHK